MRLYPVKGIDVESEDYDADEIYQNFQGGIPEQLLSGEWDWNWLPKLITVRKKHCVTWNNRLNFVRRIF